MSGRELESAAQELHNSPPRAAVDRALQLAAASGAIRPSVAILALYTALLTKTVPDYAQDVESAPFVAAFSTYAGLSSLLSRIRALHAAKGQDAELTLLTGLLACVLGTATLVRDVWSSYPQRDVVTFFCGSRLLSVTSMLSTHDWFTSGENYTRWLAQQLTEFREIPTDMVDKVFKLGYPGTAAAVFVPRNLAKLKLAYEQLRAAPQIFIAQAVLRTLESASVGAIAAIWSFLNPPQTVSIFNTAASSFPPFNQKVQRASVLVVEPQNLERLTTDYISVWGDKATLQSTSLAVQDAQTQILLSCAAQLAPVAAKRVTQSLNFVTAVSNHLENLSDRVRSLGTLVGEALGRRAGESLRFEIAYDKDEWCITEDHKLSLDDAVSELESEEQYMDVDAQDAADIQPIFTGDPPKDSQKQDTATFDSDDEGPEEKVALPVYLKDLVAYLSSDSFEKMQSGLYNGANLILRKAQFGTEVATYALELLRIAAGLTDKFNIDNFSEKRQDILTAILVAVPKDAPKVCSLLAGGDYSLYQRTSLMSALVLAAQQLKEYRGAGPASQLLPQAQHKAFITGADAMALALQDKLVVSARDKQEDRLGPQVLRMSKKLQDPNEGQAVQQPINKFSPVARYFFFPLVAAGERAARATIGGTFAPILHAHWLKTLALILHLAYPTNDMPDMVKEMVQVWEANLAHTDTIVTEALYTSILAVADVAGGILAEFYPQPLARLTDWVAGTWQSVGDDRVQKLGAAALLRLQEIQNQMLKRFTAFA